MMNLSKILVRHLDVAIGAIFTAVFVNIIVLAIRQSESSRSTAAMTIICIMAIPVLLVMMYIKERRYRRDNSAATEDDPYANAMANFPQHLDTDLAGLKK